jgi:hypothetical protein
MMRATTSVVPPAGHHHAHGLVRVGGLRAGAQRAGGQQGGCGTGNAAA